MLTSNKLKYFMAVMEEGSISKASQIKNITRTPMSRAISDLEIMLGVELFIRGKKGMTPSANGMNLYKRVAPFYKELEKIEKDIKANIRKKTIQIVITPGISDSIISHIKNSLENNDTFFYSFSYTARTENEMDLLCYFDIVISDISINQDNIFEAITSYDIYMVNSNMDGTNKQKNEIYYHDIYDDDSNQPLFTHELNTLQTLKKISSINFIELIYKVRSSDANLIATKPLLDTIDISKNKLIVEKITSKKLFIYSSSDSENIKRIVNKFSGIIE